MEAPREGEGRVALLAEGAAESSEASQEEEGRDELSDEVWRNLKCVWGVQALDAFDASLVIPSLHLYMEALGGSEKLYGVAIATFWVGRMLGLPVFGLWADRGAFRSAFLTSTLMGVGGGLAYALASLGGASSLWLVVVSRLLLGASTGVISALMAFTAVSVGNKQTKYLGLQQVVFNVVMVVSPAFASFFTLVPELRVGGTSVLDKFTYCGYFLAASNAVASVLIWTWFKDPPARERAMRPPSSPYSASRLAATARSCVGTAFRSGLWVSLVLSTQNNFSQTVVQWTLPELTQHLFHWGQRENGFIFAGMGVLGTSVSYFVVHRSERGMEDRKIILVFQMLVGTGMALMAAFFGCAQNSSAAPGAPVFFAFLAVYAVGNFGQIPGNIGLFSKLVGNERQGECQAMLFMLMSASRAVAGAVIGYGGACESWTVAVGFWVVQMLCFLPSYGVLRPASARSCIDDYQTLE